MQTGSHAPLLAIQIAIVIIFEVAGKLAISECNRLQLHRGQQMLRMRMPQDLRNALKPEHMDSWALRFNYWAQVPSGCGLMRIKAEMEAPVCNTPHE